MRNQDNLPLLLGGTVLLVVLAVVASAIGNRDATRPTADSIHAAVDLPAALPDLTPTPKTQPPSAELDASIAVSPYEPLPSSHTQRSDLSYGMFSPYGPDPQAIDDGLIKARLGTERVIGQAWGDYNRDGWLDLYVTDPAGPNTLFENVEGVLIRSEFADAVELPDLPSTGVIFADTDRDGWVDLFVLNDGEPNVLFRNQSGTGFQNVTEDAGLAGDPDAHSRTASFGDFNQDGYLDLYVANWSCSPTCGRPTVGDSDELYQNNGDGTFTEVTQYLTGKVEGAGFVASFADYDNDGDPDIYLVNDTFVNPVGNALWRNDGPGCNGWCFEEVSAELGADTKLMGMGLATGDIDNDNDFDFYISNAGPPALLLNEEAGTLFDDVTVPAGAATAGNTVSWGTVMVDLNNDRFLDLYLGVTQVLPEFTSENSVFLNRGNGQFEEVLLPESPIHEGKTLGVATADYDNDGWVDILIGNYETGYVLYHNEIGRFETNHRVTFSLINAVGSPAIGARATLRLSSGETLMHEVIAGSSLGGGSSTDLYFGLGREQIEAVTIRWPNGEVQELGRLEVNQRYSITQSSESN